ncbi:hypothetical protein AM1_4524 [Acaryochloris marina MBIC11017]|uniref:Uncharacterized protein n=1 Tax=Acaryochloris marina (strain MBIC 11017) TaxID=329726 RepID=B0BZ55_ACAM1|nr:hypothetical protein AM1_4524 [Acaryochloris marina MBIC11017]
MGFGAAFMFYHYCLLLLDNPTYVDKTLALNWDYFAGFMYIY